ncbi:MAG TPA: type II CAAX endopeptidase family protein [Candidatus Saccharimonadales bacterium]|nr:type II CAAX endopeptidase family protein [Candidatus Saccharimonadales bacterium]
MPWDFWLIFLILATFIPWRGRVRLQRLLSQPAFTTKEKLVLYGTTIAFQWILMAIVAWRALARGLSQSELGLARGFDAPIIFWSVTGALALGAFQWFNLRRLGRMTGAVPELMRKLSERLLPQTAIESGPYAALAVTAGVCEEFVYRGFVMAALTRTGMAQFLVVLLSSVMFGLAHAYQGRSGIIGTTLMGLVFGLARAVTLSLAPAVVWHACVDLVAGTAGPRFLCGSFGSQERQ